MGSGYLYTGFCISILVISGWNCTRYRYQLYTGYLGMELYSVSVSTVHGVLHPSCGSSRDNCASGSPSSPVAVIKHRAVALRGGLCAPRGPLGIVGVDSLGGHWGA
eukprot:GHVO01049163.1.p1 GENE.GHVO01049163.1~~GHVO01049163.1.p1  ORF type:complete len:106 (+),score=0.94 GHVO01049163.1:408-725(+)